LKDRKNSFKKKQFESPYPLSNRAICPNEIRQRKSHKQNCYSPEEQEKNRVGLSLNEYSHLIYVAIYLTVR
jgi:hypothetical protein